MQGKNLTDEEALALQLPEPTPREPALEGNPVESFLNTYEDGVVEIGVWECSPGRFPSKKQGIGEAMFILAGKGRLIEDSGAEIALEPGATIITPDGWSGTWEIEETVRKKYVIWKTA